MRARLVFLTAFTLFFLLSCGKRKDSTSTTNTAEGIPEDWDGTADYTNGSWEVAK